MFWILWVNKRYLKYIKPFNPKKEIRLADSKLKTKKLLRNLDIPHPQLLDIIKTRKELRNYDFSIYVWKDFVVKPNKWSKWKWIMICHMIDDHFVKVWSSVLSIDDFKKKIADILDGKYSLTMGNDIALIEEKIIPGDDFKIFCEYWLADIRLICMNLVPVMAMLRYPTPESEWKANIAAWWIGFGIDIAEWKIVSMYYKWKIYEKKFPSWYEKFLNQQIPYWDDILLYSSQIQYFTNIWYLWLDWVIGKNDPLLLEINARAGMEIQLVNGVWLETRLKKIEDMKISSPSKWVEIWKTLFSKKSVNPTIQKDIIYLEQPWILKVELDENTLEYPVTIKVDLDNKYNYADSKLIKDFDKKYTIKFDKIILDNVKFKEKKWLKNTITLWIKTLDNFIIVPKKKDIKSFSIWNKEKFDENDKNILIELDNSIDKISKKLNLSKIIKPLNYMEELDNFITWGWNYNPKFEYKYPSDKVLEELEDDIKSLNEKYFDVKSEHKSELLDIFKEKILEMEYKLEMIKAYKKQNFSSIWKYNRLLYGDIDQNLIDKSKMKVSPFTERKLWKRLTIYEVLKLVKKHLKEKGLSDIKVKIETDLSSRILVKRWDPIVVSISKSSEFYEKEIDMILAHEIDVHVVRYVNWKKTWWKILQSGTWFYITDEEWLAIWNSLRYSPENYEKNAMYEKYLLIQQAENADFVSLANIIRWLHPQEWLLKIFRRTMRFKRWIQNTAFKGFWTAYFKDKIYLDGYEKINNWIETEQDFQSMLKWKYKIKDLRFINTENE